MAVAGAVGEMVKSEVEGGVAHERRAGLGADGVRSCSMTSKIPTGTTKAKAR